jgi:hypothetical protein
LELWNASDGDDQRDWVGDWSGGGHIDDSSIAERN